MIANDPRDDHTTLGDFGRVPKTSPLLDACGHIDEAVAAVHAAAVTGVLTQELATVLDDVRSDLQAAAARLSLAGTPDDSGGRAAIDRLDRIDDRYGAQVPTAEFAERGARSQAGALLCLARTVTRRAERAAWSAVAGAAHRRQVAVQLNRTGSALLIMAYQVDLAEDRALAMIGSCGVLPADADVVRPT